MRTMKFTKRPTTVAGWIALSALLTCAPAMAQVVIDAPPPPPRSQTTSPPASADDAQATADDTTANASGDLQADPVHDLVNDPLWQFAANRSSPSVTSAPPAAVATALGGWYRFPFAGYSLPFGGHIRGVSFPGYSSIWVGPHQFVSHRPSRSARARDWFRSGSGFSARGHFNIGSSFTGFFRIGPVFHGHHGHGKHIPGSFGTGFGSQFGTGVGSGFVGDSSTSFGTPGFRGTGGPGFTGSFQR